eukprot:CAMPEP_0170598272 /NCGR_PEP_ID=MMETSP0224-20130122/16155_1 /TAXON_ID=285029 /ORGANISM="Togula jolla, Strain CCCM 725" /LENGTH=254 /DNA_ID=CAMNT_0010922805 /DNA_START=83 /DNA_END=849 /DNA_ORIENTATION=+
MPGDARCRLTARGGAMLADAGWLPPFPAASATEADRRCWAAPTTADTRALGRQARLEWQKLVPAERRAFHDQALAAAAAAVASGNDAVEPPPTPKRKSGQSPAPAAEAPATPRQAGGRQRAASGSLAPTPSTPSGPATSTSDGDEADTAAAAVQSGAKAAEPPLPEAKPKVAPRRPRAAAKPATKAVGTAAKLAAMSVGALRAKAKYMGVSKHEVERCVEKRDLIELLTTVEKAGRATDAGVAVAGAKLATARG